MSSRSRRTLPAPGFWNGDDPDSINGGFEYCMAADIATSLGLDKVKVVNVSFDALVAGQTSDFDIALSQVTITDERAKVVDFSSAVLQLPIRACMVNKGTDVANMDEAKKREVGCAGEHDRPDLPRRRHQARQRGGSVPGHAVDVRRAHCEADRRGDARHLDRARSGRGRATARKRWSRSSAPARSTAGIYQKGSPNAAALDKIISDYASDGTLQALQTKWLAPVFGGDPSDDPLHHPVARG